MRIKFHRTEKKEKKIFISNQAIKTQEVYLIDENGENVGVISTHDAIVQAKELEMDLVLVNPKAEPPVAKIVDLGQLKYQHDKKLHKQKMLQKKVETKNIRITFRISEHDLNLRLNQAIKFLSKEQKIKIELILKGRERQHQARAKEMLMNFVEKLKQKEDLNVEIEQDLTSQGGRLTIILINKK